MLILGSHGTSQESALNILKDNYKGSIGDSEWLGDGVYFFTKGVVSNTSELAKKWAITQAWDNATKSYKYSKYAVVNSEIVVEEHSFLDLTTSEGIEIFEYLKKRFLGLIRKQLNFLDGHLLNLARGEGILPLDVVKGNFYIKFVEERLNFQNFRTPNCTICVVFDPEKNITHTNIFQSGSIYETL